VEKMAQIQLADEERDRLREVLHKYLAELSWEIAFTHTKDSLDYLRKRRDFVEGFIERLAG
jgi:hypothetical protein